MAGKLGLLLCHTKALPLGCRRNNLDGIPDFIPGLSTERCFFTLKHMKVPVQYQNHRIITDIYNLVKCSKIAILFQLFEFIYYLTIEFCISLYQTFKLAIALCTLQIEKYFSSQK